MSATSSTAIEEKDHDHPSVDVDASAETSSSSAAAEAPPAVKPAALRPRCVIMRGLPGSGKSTLAKTILREFLADNGIAEDSAVNTNTLCAVLSTDDFFVTEVGEKGKYTFVPQRLGDAHSWNIRRAGKALLHDRIPLVLIDNTNTKAWEPKPYAYLARAAGYDMEVRETDTPWRRDTKELAKRNVHGVPRNKIEEMLDRWEADLTVAQILAAEVPAWSQQSMRLAEQLVREHSQGGR